MLVVLAQEGSGAPRVSSLCESWSHFGSTLPRFSHSQICPGLPHLLSGCDSETSQDDVCLHYMCFISLIPSMFHVRQDSLRVAPMKRKPPVKEKDEL